MNFMTRPNVHPGMMSQGNPQGCHGQWHPGDFSKKQKSLKICLLIKSLWLLTFKIKIFFWLQESGMGMLVTYFVMLSLHPRPS